MIDLDEIRGYDEALCDDGEQLTRAEQHRRALLAYVDELREAAGRLADAADDVGVHHFDTDSFTPQVEEMQAATVALRALLERP
jgi:hypothetical protein